jgi:hypothetical protein
MIKAIQTGKIPIWLVFACQVHIDIRFIIDADSEKPFKELQSSGRRLHTTLSNHVEFSRGQYSRPEEPILAEVTIEELAYWFFNDLDLENRQDTYSQANIPMDQVEPHYLQHRHPLLCGLMNFRLELSLHEAGLFIANKWQAIRRTSILDNFLRHELPGSKIWPDMETVCVIHGNSATMFDCGETSTTRDYFSQYVTSTSPSSTLTRIQPMRQKSRKSTMPKRPRITQGESKLIAQSVASEIFMERYRYNPDHELEPILTLENAEALLNNLSRTSTSVLNPQTLPTDSNTENTICRDPPLFELPKITVRNDSLFATPSKDYATTHTLSPIALLSILTTRLVSESILLNFNYVTLHQRCTFFERALYDEFGPEMEVYNKERGYENRTEEQGKMSNLGHCILLA